MTNYLAQVIGDYNPTTEWSFGWEVTSDADAATLLATWAAAWTAAWNDGTHGLKVLYPTTTSVTEFVVARLDINYKQVAKVRTSAALAGTATGDSETYDTGLTVIKRSSTAIGKKARGRSTLPAPEETFIVANVLSGPATTRVSAAVNAVKAALNATGATLFVATKPNPRHVPPILTGPPVVMDVLEASNKPGAARYRTRKQKPSYV